LLNGLIEAASAAGDRRVEWYALLEQAGRRRFTDPTMSVGELFRVAEDAIPIFEELGDELGLARAWRRMSHVATSRCHFGQGEDAARRALEHARAASDAQEEARSIDLLCTCLLYGPAPAGESVGRCVKMLGRVSGNLLMQANIASSLSGLLAMRGKFDDARTAYRRAEKIYEDLGLRLPLAGLRQIVGEVELLADEPQAAERELRRAYQALSPGGAAAALFAAQLGRTLIAQERNDEAAELAAGSRESCGDDIWARIVCLGLASRIEVLRGSSAAGVALAHEAVSLAGGTDALNVQGDALVDLAYAQQSAGQGTEAIEALERARRSYELKGNVVSARRAEALLTEV
jgi:tetratricopeptide (TPR) repeat protein